MGAEVEWGLGPEDLERLGGGGLPSARVLEVSQVEKPRDLPSFGKGALALERIGGGQSNPTYFVDHGGARMVLRKKPNGAT